MATSALPDRSTRRDVKVMTLITVGHFLSHFYILILPPLFPILTGVYGVGYTELGLALGLLNLVTAVTQAPVGFLVDRFGARGILIGGLVLFALATLLIGVVPSYRALILFMVLAGLGNAVFHPADYAILAGSIGLARMGRAYSIHSFGGYFGFAAAPPVVVFLTGLVGWQWALILCGLAGIAVALVLFLNSAVLVDDRVRQPAAASRTAPAAPRGLLLSWPVMLSFLFFILLALGQTGLSGFSVAAIKELYQATLEQANWPLTAFLAVSAVGVLCGGFLADRSHRHDLMTAGYLGLLALALLPVALWPLPLWAITLHMAAAGFFSGAIAPSRDIMIRQMTPPGASGRVFGFVTTGFNVGGLIAPFLFGPLVDRHLPIMVFWAAAGIALATGAMALVAGRGSRRAQL